MAAATLQEVSAGRATQRVGSGVAVEIPALGRTVDYFCLRRVLSTIDFTVLGSVSCAFLVRAGAPDVVTVALVGRHCWRGHRYRVAIVTDGRLLLTIAALFLRGERHGHAGQQQGHHRRNYAGDPDLPVHTKPTPSRRWTRALHPGNHVAGTDPLFLAKAFSSQCKYTIAVACMPCGYFSAFFTDSIARAAFGGGRTFLARFAPLRCIRYACLRSLATGRGSIGSPT